MARLCPLFSGSSGNCYYIGSGEEGILVDIGRSAKQVTARLEQCSISTDAVKAVFITHEHADHVAGLRVFASRYHLPVYASRGTLSALGGMGCLSEKFQSSVIESSGVECAGMRIVPFPLSHDSAECVGYRILTQDGRSVALSTDLGYLSEKVQAELTGADFVVLESNHDIGMLENGPYPYPLKKRILSAIGHLSNADCAAELSRLARHGTTRFLLAHLSAENNTPELAYQTSLCSLNLNGFKQDRDFQLFVAPRENVSGASVFF